MKTKHGAARESIVSLIKLLVLLYLFFLSIQLIQGSFKMFGKDFAQGLVQVTSNPLVGLCIGILVTSIIQSSSTTTSILVGLVASGAMTIRGAIPIVMGANIGTTVTCAIVALAHVTRGKEFERAYSAASVHDLFNLLSVLILLPLEVSTHVIERCCIWMTDLFVGIGGFKTVSPVKMVVKPAAHFIRTAVESVLPEGSAWAAVALLVIAVLLLALALKYLSGTLKAVITGRVEKLVNDYLFSRPYRALLAGVVVTAAVQSSSITTSLVVPLIAGGIFTLEKVFPFMIGSNIGTTVTAILASMVTGSPEAISVALGHLLFNCGGTAIWYPLRKIPITLAKKLAWFAAHYKALALIYILILFYAIPLLIVFLLK